MLKSSESPGRLEILPKFPCQLKKGGLQFVSSQPCLGQCIFESRRSVYVMEKPYLGSCKRSFIFRIPVTCTSQLNVWVISLR
jgi:hypothetical protein